MTDNSIPSKRSPSLKQRNFTLPWRFLLIAGSLLALLHFYVGVRLLSALAISDPMRIGGAIALILSWAAILAGTLARFFIGRQALADKVTWVGMLAMGLLSSLFILTLMRDVVFVVVLLLTRNVSHTFIGQSAIMAVAIAFLTALVGFINARRGPRVIEIEIAVVGLPIALNGFTIAQISDVHIGPTIKGDYLSAIVENVNKLKPDLIAITGDLVDGSVEQLSEHTASLVRLSARHGAYFVTGNHEYYSGELAWTAEFRRLGLRVLTNEHGVIHHEGATLVVAGVTDYSAHNFDPAQRSDPHAAIAGAPAGAGVRILLAHQPRTATAALAAGFDLQLSGHTHGGQFWPWNLFVPLQQPFTAGLHRLGALWVYTTRGAGYWGPPMRLGAPSEIALLRLVSEVPSAVD